MQKVKIRFPSLFAQVWHKIMKYLYLNLSQFNSNVTKNTILFPTHAGFYPTVSSQ